MKLIILLCVAIMTIFKVEAGGNFDSLKISSQKFAIDLYKNLPNSTENVLLSPLSAHTILALLQTGAANDCLSELANVLYLPKKRNKFSSIFQNSLTAVNGDSNINMSIANAIFSNKDFQLPKQYNKFAKIFDAAIQEIDFTKPKQAAKKINNWVANHTNGRIKDIVDEDSVDSTTVIMLINALYFNANWEYPFDLQLTTSRPFYINDKEETKTDLMIQTSSLYYKENKQLNAKILELPYVGDDFKMIIVLPKEKNGISLLEKNISKIFDEDNFEEHEVTVMLPKFTIESKIELGEMLEKLGLKSIFQQLDLKGIPKNENLKVSKVLQRTFIEVNEIGTEAAAATGVGIQDRMGSFDQKFFIADHPFLFYIRHNSTGNIMFMGKFNKP